jgi:hypothetical protein
MSLEGEVDRIFELFDALDVTGADVTASGV